MRIIITSQKAEDKDEAREERYRQNEERDRQEQNRRDDLDQEKGIWHEVMEARIDQGWTVEKSLIDADKVLELYRKRFQ